MDFGIPVQLEKIVYTPRNTDNFIRDGYVYELFYFDNDWISAGKMTATSDSLLYRCIPENVLLYLQCHTGGVQERVFIYENAQQVFK